MNIEELAKKLFEYYGLQETGVKPDWKYLKKERQLAWINDVHLIADALLSQLKVKVKPSILPSGTVPTSYIMGYNEGIKAERTNFIRVIEELEQDVEDQIFLFKEGMENVQK